LGFWTDEERQYLIDNVMKMTYEQIGHKIGRSEGAVKDQWDKLKQKNPKLRKYNKKAKWTDEMDKYIMDNMATMRNEEIAKGLGMNTTTIASRLQELRRKYPEICSIIRPQKKKATRSDKGKPKPQKKRNKGVEEIKECPECGTKRRFNKLDQGTYYCMNCLKEFNRYGKFIMPVL
jgi:biotin operon repressor